MFYCQFPGMFLEIRYIAMNLVVSKRDYSLMENYTIHSFGVQLLLVFGYCPINS